MTQAYGKEQTMTEQDKEEAKGQDTAFLLTQYQILAGRNNQHNSPLWSVPSLLFLAQSFLWTVAVQEQYDMFVRVLLSGLSVLISFASLQLFLRNRIMEVAISEQMKSIELEMKGHNSLSLITSSPLNEREMLIGGRETKMEQYIRTKAARLYRHPIIRVQSNQIWMAIMYGAFLISLGLFLWLTLPKVLPILQGWLIH